MVQKLGTKAETLQRLYQRLKYAKVLPQMCFTVQDWNADKERVLENYERLEWNQSVVVRSSSLMEDTETQSLAGKYESVLGVCGEKEFIRAVDRVIASYTADSEKRDMDKPEQVVQAEETAGQDQVLVQPMLREVLSCGVAFTVDPNTLGNYYVINYNSTGSTSAVTSGGGTDNVLYYQFKDEESGKKPDDMDRLYKALKELELFFDQENLDVEFAFAQGGLYILQVRALCLSGAPMDRDKQKKELERIKARICREQSQKPFLCGRKTIYSVMTDWNPAEMIGIRPKPLALSLYREIITDSVWAYQRDNYGYRNLRSFPLMVDFAGLPYIDVRVSFNSFVPAQLEERLSEKLVNYYIDRLAENPQKHDKAEFEILFSCYTLDLPERIQILKNYGFTDEEIRKILDALRNVTNHIIDHKNGLWRKDYEKIQLLRKRYDEIMASGMDDLEKVYWLLEDCKRYGTLPFAGLARGAFIAVQLLRSMVACEILTESDYELFMNEVDTVSSGMNTDFHDMSKTAFLKKYGHLRPGTYDITSLRYDEAPELYFEWQDAEKSQESVTEEFRLSLKQLNKLKKKLMENGLTNDILELMDFIKTVIEGREYGKFVFTRNLSKALQLIGKLGKSVDINIEDCAFLNVRTIYEMYMSAKDIRTEFLYSIQQGKREFEMTQSVTLPPVLIEPEEVTSFYYPDSEPNFITSRKVSGNVCLMEMVNGAYDLSGKIVLIPSADPGYDWIFSHKIGGFITMYGGANSHMAIRAGELGIPAAVGVGEKQFQQYKNASYLELDAQGKMIKILRRDFGSYGIESTGSINAVQSKNLWGGILRI